MKLYQAGYYRLGGYGSGSGWKIVAPSAGMSEIAKAGFRGIASRLSDLKQTVQAPPEAMGIFRHERFIYLMHVNYAASGEDSRGVAYVHGYCFHLAEYYELAVCPEILFGIVPEEFDTEYHPQLAAYPVRESLNYRNMNERRLLDRYRLSKEQYKKLLLGAICALEGYSGPMCIKYGALREQGTQTYRDILYLIMKGLPYHLRSKLLSFSWHGAQTAICFSDQVQGENYADLDTGIFRCEDSRLNGYQFTKLYQMDLFYSSKDLREQIFQNIAAFIQETYADPLKDAGCALIEAGFQKKIKKNDSGIEPETVVSLLQELFRYELRYGGETSEYLAILLDAANQGDIRLEDPKLTAEIKNAYEQCQDAVLLEPMALYEARGILARSQTPQSKNAGFAALLELKNGHANDLYPAVCSYLEALDADYFCDYFWNRFLPGELTSLKKSERFFYQNGPHFTAKEHQLFQKLIKDLVVREMQAADSFEELCLAAQTIDRIRQNPARADGYERLWEETCTTLWNRFQMDWFETDRVRTYRQYEVQRLSCPNAKKVSKMIAQLEEAESCTDLSRLWQLLYDTQSAEEKHYRRLMQRGLRETFYAGIPEIDLNHLDRSLLLYYDPDNRQFDLVKWISQWAKTQELEPCAERFADLGKHSQLLADQTRRKYVMQYLKEAVKSRKQTAYNHLPYECQKALRALYYGLKGKPDRTEETPLLIDSLHREMISLFVLFTMAVCGICLYRYGSGDILISLGFAIFAAVGLVFSLMVQALTGKETRSRTDAMGLGSGLAKCLYAGIPVAFFTASLLVYKLGGFAEKAVCIMVFLGLTAAMVLIGGIDKDRRN